MSDSYDPRLSIQGEGETVLLVPGLDGTGQLFYRQVPSLAKSYRVGTYALRDSAGTMEQLVDDLAEVVDAASSMDERAILVGESFGGAVALSFAIAHPRRVRALVVLNSFPHFTPQIRLHLAIAGLTALPWGMMGLVRRLTAARLHSRHTHRDEVRRFMELTSRASREGYLSRLKILLRYDVRERLQEIQVPTLFLASELDHLVPSVSQARYMSTRVSQAATQVLKGHGHICLIAPDLDLAQILADWRSPPAT